MRCGVPPCILAYARGGLHAAIASAVCCDICAFPHVSAAQVLTGVLSARSRTSSTPFSSALWFASPLRPHWGAVTATANDKNRGIRAYIIAPCTAGVLDSRAVAQDLGGVSRGACAADSTSRCLCGRGLHRRCVAATRSRRSASQRVESHCLPSAAARRDRSRVD